MHAAELPPWPTSYPAARGSSEDHFAESLGSEGSWPEGLSMQDSTPRPLSPDLYPETPSTRDSLTRSQEAGLKQREKREHGPEGKPRLSSRNKWICALEDMVTNGYRI